MKHNQLDAPGHIGPVCTVGAHGQFPGPCPNMPQPSPPASAAPYEEHTWPDQFVVDWEFYFVKDTKDKPPYAPAPTTAYNRTLGRTSYQHDAATGLTNMREDYDTYCIPVFGAPSSPMGSHNNYACSFVNVGTTNTSYVLLYADKPAGAPECCIIGRPFHAPPPTFHHNMPVKWTQHIGGDLVDVGAVFDKDAGGFNYAFERASGNPHSFWMQGVPWVATWMFQRFGSFSAVTPPASSWDIPASCDNAQACAGWGGANAANAALVVDE